MTRRVGSPLIGSERSTDSSETDIEIGQAPIYDPLYHHCRLETCFYIGTGQVITEIECSACGRVWRLCSKTIESEAEGPSKIYFWQPDPELAIVKEQRKKAAIEKRRKMAAQQAAKRRAASAKADKRPFEGSGRPPQGAQA